MRITSVLRRVIRGFSPKCSVIDKIGEALLKLNLPPNSNHLTNHFQ